MFKKILLFTLSLAKITLAKENDDFSPESSFDYDPYDYSYAYEYEATNQHLDTDHDSPSDTPDEAGFRAILGGPTGSEGRSSPRGPRPDGPFSIGSEGGPSGDPVADRDGLRRLQERLALIHHLVGHPRYHHSINALRYYGCWCLPHMRDDDAPGQVIPHKGKPADAVDSACMKAQKCYECAYRDHEQHVDKNGKNYRCISRGNGYAYNLHFDQNDFSNRDKRSIECIDDPNNGDIRHSCRRSLCECDRQFAEDLRAGMGEWKEENRQKMENIPGTGGLKEWVGGFDPKEKCVASGNGSGDNAGQKPDQCCGFKGGVRLPFYSNQGRVKCCGDKTYDSLIYTCCEDGRLTMANTC